jgi:hypothetical protein
MGNHIPRAGVLTVTLSAAAAAVLLGAFDARPATGAPGAGGAAGRCVGMFLDPGAGRSKLPDSVPAEGTNLVVRGTVPCMDQVMAWSARGPYRIWEDGTVEFLASPIPPCPGGDHYVWIAFPR